MRRGIGFLMVIGVLASGVGTKNRGRRKAKRSVTRYYLSLNRKRDRGDQRLAGKRVVRKLKPRRRSRGRARVRIPAGLALGQYRLLACADDRKKVRESRERNNCRGSRVLGRAEGSGGDRRNPLTRGAAGVAAATRTSADGEPVVQPTNQ